MKSLITSARTWSRKKVQWSSHQQSPGWRRPAYCVPDPNTGLVYYVPVVQAAAPCYPDATYLAQPQQEISHVVTQTELQCHDDSYQSDFSKPFEQWSQEDYELYYNQN